MNNKNTGFGALKARKTRLPKPPIPTEARDNLEQPESAPLATTAPPPKSPKKTGHEATITGRTEPFSTRCKKGWRNELRRLSANKDITMIEYLECAVDFYKNHGDKK